MANSTLNRLANTKVGLFLGLDKALGHASSTSPFGAISTAAGDLGFGSGGDTGGFNPNASSAPAMNVAPTSVQMTGTPPTFPDVNPTQVVIDPTATLLPSVNNLSNGELRGNLPIRAEKRIIPSGIDANSIQSEFEAGNPLGTQLKTHQLDQSDFMITGARKDLTDFIKVRIPHRGIVAATGLFAANQDAEFQFLVNPRTVAISKQTVDTQAVTRGGWQFGVWGEDVSSIRISGQTAGSYFALGLTDEFQFYSQSYRNLMQLLQVFENNGYWFEGEEYNEGPLAADYLRRRIRMHQDLELWVGNFIWSGMFESMNITQNAENPFQLEFELTFIAWKERYRDSSGYWNSLPNNIQRGHSYPAVIGSTGQAAVNTTVSQQASMSINSKLAAISDSLISNLYGYSPSVVASSAEDLLFSNDPQAVSNQGQSECVVLDPANLRIWNS